MTDKIHEKLHLGDYIPDINWMENLYFGGLDESGDMAFGVHCKIRPDQKRAEIRTFVEMGKQNSGFGGRYAINSETFEYPIYKAECIEPFRHWRIRVDTKGWPFADTGGIMGLELTGREPVLPFGFEIDVTSRLPVADWAQFKGIGSADSAGHGHYDQGVSWNGTLRLGDKTVKAKGLGIRDHSWGPRNFREMDGVWFAGCTFEDERAYFAGQALLDSTGIYGFSYFVDSSGVKLLPRPDFKVLKGKEIAGEYELVQVATEGVRLNCHIRSHILMPLLPERYLSGDGFAAVDTGTGTGYAMMERGTLYTPAEIEQLKTDNNALS